MEICALDDLRTFLTRLPHNSLCLKSELLIKKQGGKGGRKKNDDDCGTQKFLPPHAGKIKWHRRQRRLTGSASKRKTEEVKNVGEEEKKEGLRRQEGENQKDKDGEISGETEDSWQRRLKFCSHAARCQ